MIKRLTWMIVVLGFLTPATNALAAEPLKKVVMAQADGLWHFPTYLARAAGLFEQEGVALEAFTVNSGVTQAAALAAGSIDITPITLLQVMRLQQQGGDIVAISTLFDAMPLNIVLSDDAITKAGITGPMSIDDKIKRMKGLTLAISGPGTSTDTFARALFLARGINPDGYITLQPIGDGPASLAALQKKIIDGFSNGPPWIETAQSTNSGRAVIDPMTGEVPELVDVPYNFLATSRKVLREKPELIAAVSRAVARGIRLAHEDKSSWQKIRQYFPSVPEQVLGKAIESAARGVPKSSVVTRTQFDKTVAWVNIGAANPLKAKFEDLVEPGPAEAAEAAVAKR